MQPGRIKLDNPIFAGTLRRTSRGASYDRRQLHPTTVQDIASVRAQPVVSRPILRADVLSSRRSGQPTPQIAPTTPTDIRPPKAARAKLPKKRPQRQLLVMYSLAAILFTVGGLVAIGGWRANHKVAAQVEQMQKQTTKTAGEEQAAPSTEKPSDAVVRNYAVSPNLPRYIEIAKLGVHSRVMSMSVDRKNELQAPANVYNAGWYNASAQPGQMGAMLIDGHSGIGNFKGIFHDIGKLIAGDIITITRGDGAKFDYKVVRSETVDESKVNMSSLLVSADTAKPGLNLITCAGDQIPGTFQLKQRTMVFAVLQ